MMTTQTPKHEAPASKHEAPKTEMTAMPYKAWQWDGSHDRTTWPDWLQKHSVVAGPHGLMLDTPAGTLSVVKGEYITEDENNHLHVTKLAPTKK